MSKMSDMAMTIEELRSAAAAINEAANWLAEQFGQRTCREACCQGRKETGAEA